MYARTRGQVVVLVYSYSYYYYYYYYHYYYHYYYYYGQAGVAFDVSPFPKLKALHAALRSDPALAGYFASDMYCRHRFTTVLPYCLTTFRQLYHLTTTSPPTFPCACACTCTCTACACTLDWRRCTSCLPNLHAGYLPTCVLACSPSHPLTFSPSHLPTYEPTHL